MASLVDRLKSQLLLSGLSQKDQPLFQIINTLIDTIRGLESSVSSLSNTVNTPSSHPEWSVLTNGDLVTPELIFAGGDVVMIRIP
jgi:predicted acyltransferase